MCTRPKAIVVCELEQCIPPELSLGYYDVNNMLIITVMGGVMYIFLVGTVMWHSV